MTPAGALVPVLVLRPRQFRPSEWRRLLRVTRRAGRRAPDARTLRLAALITRNCERMLSGVITRGHWDARQIRLWSVVHLYGLSRPVLALVAPSLTERAR